MKKFEEALDKIEDKVDNQGVSDSDTTLAILELLGTNMLRDAGSSPLVELLGMNTSVLTGEPNELSPKEEREKILKVIVLALSMYYNNGGSTKKLNSEIENALVALDLEQNSSKNSKAIASIIKLFTK